MFFRFLNTTLYTKREVKKKRTDNIQDLIDVDRLARDKISLTREDGLPVYVDYVISSPRYLFTHPPPLSGADAYMFYRCFFCCFLFFFRPPQRWDNRSLERLNGFSWNFYQSRTAGTWQRGKWSFQRRTQMGARPQIIFGGSKLTSYVLVSPPGEWLRISLERGYLYGGCVKKAWTSECI